MAPPDGKSTGSVAGPLRALPIVAIAEKFRHAFLLRKALSLEAGTIIRGIKPPDSVLLLPATSSGTR